MTRKVFAIFAASTLFLQLSHAGSCSYTLAPGSSAAPSSGTNGGFAVTAGNSCNWTANSTNSWVHPAGGATGNGTASYTVDANAGSPRVGAITVGNQTFVVNQAGVPLSPGVGLNNTNLTWVTGTVYPWVSTNPPAPAYDGVNSAASGNRFIPNSTSWLQTTVVGPGVLSFWWKVDSDATAPPPNPNLIYDYLEFVVNGVSQDQIYGQVDWNYRSYSIPAGTNVLLWQYVKDAQYNTGADQGWLDQVIYTTNAPMALQEALNTCGVAWTSGGNTNATIWTGQTANSHDGKSAAQSGAIYVAQESWMQASVSGVTNLSFWWSVSSQTNYDFLEFYTNNILAKRISGSVPWQSNFFKLSAAATNVLKWRYAKTNFNMIAQGQDCGWVDQVAFSPNNFKAFPYTLQSPAVQPDGTALISVQGESGCGCQVLASSNLINWAPVTNFVTSSGGTSTIRDPAAATAPVRFYRARSQ
jgi:hypothetical protein